MATQAEMGKLYLELRERGMAGKDAAAEVRGKLGVSFPDTTIRAAATNYKKRLKAMEAGQGGAETQKIPPVLQLNETQLISPVLPQAKPSGTHKTPSVLHKAGTRKESADSASTGPDITQEISRVLHEVLEGPVLTEKLTTEFRRVAREEIDKAREGQGGTMASSEPRPTFRRTMGEGEFKTVLKSVRLSAAMWKAAEVRAAEDQLKSRGSVNGLIEFILWEYLGRPDEMVEDPQS